MTRQDQGAHVRRSDGEVHATKFPSAPAIKRIGFFHFGSDDKSDPILALQQSIRSQDPGKNCLIVIPEAFNLRNSYYRREFDPSIAGSLAVVSTEFEVALVAGSIDKCGVRSYSSAYLVDGEVCKLLSRKLQDDVSGNYTPYPGKYDEPILYRGVCVAALICLDADAEGGFRPGAYTYTQMNESRARSAQVKERHETLLRRIDACRNGAPAVLCIPARMEEVSCEVIGEAWGRRRADLAVIVANATSRHPSVIQFGDQLVRSNKSENAICAVELEFLLRHGVA